MLARGSVFWRIWTAIAVILVVGFAIGFIEWRPRGLRLLGAILLILLAGVGWGWYNLHTGNDKMKEDSRVTK